MKKENRIKPLEVGEKIYFIIYMATHWEFADDSIFKIENEDVKEKPIKIYLASNPYCSTKSEHIFRKRENAAIAISQLNAAIARGEVEKE